MVSLDQVEEQLKRVGCNFRFWGRPEIRELCNVLVPGEEIAAVTNGQYEGGFALLCATNHRMLLIDKRPLFLALEDIRYDMIVEVDYSARLLNATVFIITPTRQLTFTSWRQERLRKIVDYSQQRITEIRQHYLVQQQQQVQPQPQIQPQAQEQFWTPALESEQMLLQGQAQNGNVLNPYTHGPLLMRRQRRPGFLPQQRPTTLD